VAVLLNPANSSHATRLKSIEGAAHRTGVTILTLEARTPEEVENAFLTTARGKAGAIIVMRDTFSNQQAHQIAALAAKHRLPSIAGIREYVEAGGLMSYGPSLHDYFRHAATYVDKICKGARPGDLPVEQPTKKGVCVWKLSWSPPRSLPSPRWATRPSCCRLCSRRSSNASCLSLWAFSSLLSPIISSRATREPGSRAWCLPGR
ncbi:MAG: ABC transporter substrate-binding protein, partial [Candidatus Rokubacteria bacterium]|nr:ABC transporter substrate-binding protein [Candidatus Rokubacteria bacterium]